MSYEKWKDYNVIGKHRYVKNKKAKAILVTIENAEEVAKETRAFEVFNENGTLLTGFMSFNRCPVWLININPRGKVKKFVFERHIDYLLEEIETIKEEEQ